MMQSPSRERSPSRAKSPALSKRDAKDRRKARNWWLKQLHSWHWISAAVSLSAMLLFSVTGLTLNHAASIAAEPVVRDGRATLPSALVPLLKDPKAADAPLPVPVAERLAAETGLDPRGLAAEWTEDAYVALPGPGRDAWISINRQSGAVTWEITDRGWVSYINDLHKGRNTGNAWFWFIDVFAVACIVFTFTGLLLLQLHSKRRPLTWPLVGLSLAIPVILAIVFIH